jgi:hypothetical protein
LTDRHFPAVDPLVGSVEQTAQPANKEELRRAESAELRE